MRKLLKKFNERSELLDILLGMIGASVALVAGMLSDDRVSEPITTMFTVVISIVPAIVSSMIQRRANSVQKTTREKYPQLSVVAIILRRKQRALLNTLSALVLTMILIVSYSYWTDTSPNFLITVGIFVLIILVIAREKIVEFRVRKGFYGSNEYEAREIIQFIVDNSEDIDFTDGGKPKRIITEEDLQDIRNRVHGAIANSPATA